MKYSCSKNFCFSLNYYFFYVFSDVNTVTSYMTMHVLLSHKHYIDVVLSTLALDILFSLSLIAYIIDMWKYFCVHILKEYFENNSQYLVSENKLMQFKAWAAFALSLLECQPWTSDCVWLNLAGSDQIRIMTLNHCSAFADDTITGSHMHSMKFPSGF